MGHLAVVAQVMYWCWLGPCVCLSLMLVHARGDRPLHGGSRLRRRRSAQDLAQRPEYEGMGLGLFIAKTLLERTGAELTFANASDPFLTPDERPERCGAIVEVIWPADRLVTRSSGGIGENQQIKV